MRQLWGDDTVYMIDVDYNTTQVPYTLFRLQIRLQEKSHGIVCVIQNIVYVL